MGHLEFNGVSFTLPDGRPLLDEVTFRVGEGQKMALVGPNGTGKTTLMRIVAGDIPADGGAVSRSGQLGVMRQFIGQIQDETSVRDLLISLASGAIGRAASALDVTEAAAGHAAAAVAAAGEADDGRAWELLERDERAQLAFAQAVADWAELSGYEVEARWDEITSAAIGLPYELARERKVRTLSGGEQKRLVLEALLRSENEVLILDEPDNYLDIPAKRWLEDQLRATDKTVLFISHDRELLANAATSIVTLEPRAAGAGAWVHGGSFATYDEARAERNSRLDELRRRWDEEHAKLRALVVMYKQKAAYNDSMSSRLQAARTRLAKFEQAGPPEAVPVRQQVQVRLRGGRTAKRAVVCTDLALAAGMGRSAADGAAQVADDAARGGAAASVPAADGAVRAGAHAGGNPAGLTSRAAHGAARAGDGRRLTEPFSLELWFGERVAVIGPNGSGKSHFLRLLALGGSDPGTEHQPVDGAAIGEVAHTGSAVLGSRVRPGYFAQTHAHPEFSGRTLLQILHRGDGHRDGMAREQASRALDRYGLARAAEQVFGTLSGGQQARFQILLLELGGATLLLLDEPTDNLDLDSAEALEAGLAGFEGTVVAVTHDRWFMRGFDRFIEFGADGQVREITQRAVAGDGRAAC